jgi:hypothetical protein
MAKQSNDAVLMSNSRSKKKKKGKLHDCFMGKATTTTKIYGQCLHFSSTRSIRSTTHLRPSVDRVSGTPAPTWSRKVVMVVRNLLVICCRMIKKERTVRQGLP